MAVRFKKRGNRTSTASVAGSASSSKSRSLSRESLQKFNSRLSLSGGNRELSRVLWKRLNKQYPWLSQLRPHQRTGTEAIVSTNGFAALFAQRTGKTWVTGACLTVLRNESHDVLLVGPLTNLSSTWEKFLKEKLPWYTVLRSLSEYDAHKKKDPTGYRVLLLNPEQVSPIRDKLRRRKWDWMIWDEAQRLKNRTSKSSKDAWLIARAARRRLALTGTPMDLDPKDLWAIMRFVDASVLGDTWKNFERDYLVDPKIDLSKAKGVIQRQRMMLAYQIAKRKAPMREDKIDDFANAISSHVMRISKEDAGIEPAKVRLLKFDLDAQEEARYRKLEKTMIIKHNGQVIKTPMKIVQIGKLQQLTGGHIKDENGDVHATGTTKRRLLRKHIREKVDGEPFVIFCKYVFEVHMIHRMLERMNLGKGASLWGKVKDLKRDKRRTKMLLRFQRGKLDWLVCQQRTGGVGVDLYRARKFFVYSMGHSFIDFDQMLSRGDFLEQSNRAEFFLLAARNTIDTDIVSAVRKKKSITEMFYDRLQH